MKLPIIIQGFEFSITGVEIKGVNPTYNIKIIHGQFEAIAKIGKCPENPAAIYNVQILSMHGMTCLAEYLEELYIVYKNSSSEIYNYFKKQENAHRTSKATAS